MSVDLGLSFRDFNALKRFKNLDGLRFLCIAMVLVHQNPPFDTSSLTLLGRGFLGVDFFFVLSGFLITALMIRERNKTGTVSLRNFYLRRALRILPPYFFVVTVISFYYIGIAGRDDLTYHPIYYYLFLANFLETDIPLLTIMWSLSVEEQYYLVWPILLLIVPKRFIIPASLVLIALNVVIIMGLLPFGAPSVGPLTFALHAATYAPLILGSVLAILLHRKSGYAALRRLVGWKGSSLFGFAALVALMQFLPEDLTGLPNLAIHLAMTFVIASLVVREDSVLSPFLTHAVTARIGAVSYGIYLYHLIALDLVNRVSGAVGGIGSWLNFLAYAALAYLIAEISFRTLEAWFQSFRPGSRPRTQAVKGEGFGARAT